jgi:general secretion pathway protein H
MTARYRCYRKAAGFTLLEVLVVVVIVGVLSTAFLLSVGGGRQDKAEDEAQRFAALLRLASQEAMLRSRDLAVEMLPEGYRFLVNEEQKWQPLEDELLRPRQLAEGLSFDLRLDGAAVLLSADEEQRPRIYLFSTGEMTPFEVILMIEEADFHYSISGGVDGKLSLSDQR